MKISTKIILLTIFVLYFNLTYIQAQIRYWNQTTSFTNNSILSLSCDKKGNLYAGTSGDGVYHSIDKGLTWNRFSSGLNDLTVNYIAINKKGYVFIETGSGGGIMATYGGVYRSTDHGVNWQFCGSPGTARGLAINSEDQIFAATSWYDTYSSTGGGLLLRSNDDGITWPDTLLNTFIFTMNVDSAGNIFAIADRGFLRSTNNGASFVELTNYPSGIINSIEFGSPNEVFCTQEGSISRSLDNGNSWNNIGNGLKGNIYAIILDKSHNLFVASYYGDGIYYLKNNSNIWLPDNQGLADSNFSIRNWAMDSSGTLYCGTITGKVYRGSFSASSVEVSNFNNSSIFDLEQNYPNPFNPVTNITFTMPRRCFVTLKIYDIQGNEILTLLSKEINAGVHTIQWNASDQASGVYFYSLHTDKFQETKKLLLLK